MPSPEPEFFRKCFSGETMKGRTFRLYAGIMERSSRTPSPEFPEKHHIVPREWLTWNVGGFGFSTEDRNNVVYLSTRDKLLAMQYLSVIFLEAGDSVTYRNLTKAFSRRYKVGWEGFWRNPYIDRNTVDRLAEKRAKVLAGRKRKYDDAFLSRCGEIMNSGEDKDAAFEKVRSETGFAYGRKALEAQLERRFGKRQSVEY